MSTSRNKNEQSDRCTISVVVCTRDRQSYLRKCLAALERQSLPRRRFEVIVVDNGSTDDTRSVAEASSKRHPNFRYIEEPRAGLSIARNAGIAASRSEIV